MLHLCFSFFEYYLTHIGLIPIIGINLSLRCHDRKINEEVDPLPSPTPVSRLPEIFQGTFLFHLHYVSSTVEKGNCFQLKFQPLQQRSIIF